MKMRNEDKTKWVEALRSGKYTQATDFLEGIGGHCCLGVMQCVLSGDVERHTVGMYAGASISIPTFQWMEQHGVKDFYGAVSILTKMNDTGEANFKEIAEWIERNVETYDD